MSKPKIVSFLPVILLLVLSFIWKPLFLFYLPGALILFSKVFQKRNIIEKIAFVSISSIAFWIISFWFLRFIPLSLSLFTWIVIISSLVVGGILFKLNLRKQNSSFMKKLFNQKWLILLLLIVIFLRLIPFFTTLAPSGIDTTMHSYTARLIEMKNGIPNSYKPILPVESFGSYAAGFHSLSAQISLLSNLEVFRSVFLLGSLLSVFVFLGLFTFLVSFQIQTTKAFFVSLLASFLSLNPQMMSIWGGYPTMLAFSFAIFSISSFQYVLRSKKFIWIMLFVLTTVATLLSHFIMFGGLFIVLCSLFLYYSILLTQKKSNDSLFVFLKRIATSIGLSISFLLPFLLSVNLSTTETGRNFTVNWVRYLWTQIHSILVPFNSIIPNMPVLIGLLDIMASFVYSFGVGFLLLVFMVIVFTYMQWNQKQKQLFFVLLVPLIISMFISRFELVSFFFLFYPERIMLFALLPLTYVFALVKLPKHLLKIMVVILIVGIVFNIVIMNQNGFRNHYYDAIDGSISKLQFVYNDLFFGNYLVYAFSRDQNRVTNDDLIVFDWMKKNIDSAFVLNPFDDAGKWIPGIAGFPVVNTHTNPFMYEEAQSQKLLTNYTHIFVGSKLGARTGIKKETNTTIYDTNSSLQLVFSSGNSKLYEIK